MIVATAAELIGFIRELLVLQERLVAAFRNAFPRSRDWQFLLDFPSFGELNLDGAMWSFRKHGSGLRFVSSQGVIVDAHCWLGRPELFDAWRLLQYVESVVPRAEVPASEAELEASLEQLHGSGQIERATIKGGFRLK